MFFLYPPGVSGGFFYGGVPCAIVRFALFKKMESNSLLMLESILSSKKKEVLILESQIRTLSIQTKKFMMNNHELSLPNV